jgi:hypothetical protein
LIDGAIAHKQRRVRREAVCTGGRCGCVRSWRGRVHTPGSEMASPQEWVRSR